jgi:hypothetical protein
MNLLTTLSRLFPAVPRFFRRLHTFPLLDLALLHTRSPTLALGRSVRQCSLEFRQGFGLSPKSLRVFLSLSKPFPSQGCVLVKPDFSDPIVTFLSSVLKPVPRTQGFSRRWIVGQSSAVLLRSDLSVFLMHLCLCSACPGVFFDLVCGF